MAAKQGTLAQLSAQAEDAKRAVLSKAGASSWFSNLNTVCTIKSAPPRSPEVLQLLATKSGWLYKRNEQHVWQARWCCVVPHMFLYYFDVTAVTGTGSISNPSSAQQEEWNKALRTGMGNRKPHEKRSHFPLFHGGNDAPQTVGASNASMEAPEGSISEDIKTAPGAQNIQPAGIIDLECYSTIHRSSWNANVLELAGEDQVNPDLRPFYFCVENLADVEEWSSALLNNRHAALTDEVDAYKQVANGFAQQLQVLHTELDETSTRIEENEQLLYRVRSQTEETRRTVYRIIEDCWERPVTAAVDIVEIQEQRAEFRRNMETVRQQDMGVTAAVQLLAEYIGNTENVCVALQQMVNQLQSDVQKSGQTDQAEIQELQAAHENALAQHAAEKGHLMQQLAAAQASNQTLSKELQDVQKDLSSTKMEVTMLLSQQRNKLATQQQHKKILKKEVIELRQQLEDAASEQSSLKHECEKRKLQLEQERSKSDLLTRYVDKMESQVQVQQNMMEMMSHAGGSVYGGGMSVVHHSGRSIGGNNNDFTPNRRNKADQHDVEVDGDDAVDDFEHVERTLLLPPNVPGSPTKSGGRRRWARGGYVPDDVDNKSHMSELTEDRTQRDLVMQNSRLYGSYMDSEPHISPTKRQYDARYRKRVQELRQQHSPRPQGPPAVIIGVNKNGSLEGNLDDDDDLNGREDARDLQTIGNSVRSQPSVAASAPPLRRNHIPRSSTRDAASVADENGSKLSVAQRARLEADRLTTPVRLRLDERSLASLQKINLTEKSTTSTASTAQVASAQLASKPSNSERSITGGIWKRMELAVLGPSLSDEEGSFFTSEGGSTRITDMTEAADKREEAKRRFVRRSGIADEKKSSDSVSNLSLQERSQLQRDKQLRFLREQGLIKEETDIKGGAGAHDTVSVTSSNATGTSPSKKPLSPSRTP